MNRIVGATSFTWFILAGIGVFCTLSGVAGVMKASESSSEESLRKGRQIFHRYCASCHGTKGEGDGYRLLGPDPTDLTSPSIQEKADEDLLKSIHQGKLNMPAWNIKLTPGERESVLNYIRTLAK